uniref:Bifunctional inhibitor/plant lipid transfer protein/seed storage helical domain-containing protein n=1 Tax=Oryza rufipogon TaxID=4529 RepID=A0A0E0QXY8_ORYRU
MGGRSAACFLLVVLVLLGTPTSADECRDISTKDLFCLKYLCKSFCLDEARNWGGTAGYVDQYWCKGQRLVFKPIRIACQQLKLNGRAKKRCNNVSL